MYLTLGFAKTEPRKPPYYDILPEFRDLPGDEVLYLLLAIRVLHEGLLRETALVIELPELALQYLLDDLLGLVPGYLGPEYVLLFFDYAVGDVFGAEVCGICRRDAFSAFRLRQYYDGQRYSHFSVSIHYVGRSGISITSVI